MGYKFLKGVVLLVVGFSNNSLHAQENRAAVLADSVSAILDSLSTRVSQETSRIVALNQAIESRPLTSDANQAQTIRDLTERIRVLERINTQRYSVRITSLQLRYEAGAETLDQIIERLNTLEYAAALASAVGNLNQLSNPRAYSGFETVLTRTQTGLDGDGREGLKNPTGIFGIAGSLTQNHPILSTAYSVVSLFFAKGMNPAAKSRAQPEMTCALAFTATAYEDSREVQAMLRQQQRQLNALGREAEESFGRYAAVVGFNGGYREYLNDKASLPRRFRQMNSRYFQTLRADSLNSSVVEMEQTSDSIAAIELQLTQVRDLVSRYEDMVRTVDASITHLESLPAKYVAAQQCSSLDNITTRIAELRASTQQVRTAFNNAYGRRLFSAEQKRTLFGF